MKPRDSTECFTILLLWLWVGCCDCESVAVTVSRLLWLYVGRCDCESAAVTVSPLWDYESAAVTGSLLSAAECHTFDKPLISSTFLSCPVISIFQSLCDTLSVTLCLWHSVCDTLSVTLCRSVTGVIYFVSIGPSLCFGCNHRVIYGCNHR